MKTRFVAIISAFLISLPIFNGSVLAQEIQQDIITGMYSVAGGTNVQSSNPAPDVSSVQFTNELESIWRGNPGGYEAINLVNVYSKPINNPVTNYNYQFWSTLFSKAKSISPNLKIQMSAFIHEIDTNKNDNLDAPEKNNFIVGLDSVLGNPNSDVIGGWIIADEPSSVGDYTIEDVAWIYDTIKLRSQKPIYITEQAKSNVTDFAKYKYDILMIDHYSYPNIFEESIQTTTQFIAQAKNDLSRAGRSEVPIHVVLVAGEETCAVNPETGNCISSSNNTLEEDKVASHGITHSVVRKMLDIGVQGIWFYAWRVSNNFSDDAVERWVTNQNYSEVIETEPYDVDYLVTGFANDLHTDNAIYLSDIGNGDNPGSGIVYNSNSYYPAFLNSADLMGEEDGIDTDHLISQNLRSTGDGDDELFTVFKSSSNNTNLTYIDSDASNPDSYYASDINTSNITATTSGDFDGDGDDELIIGSKVGINPYLKISQDGKSLETFNLTGSSNNTVTHLTTGDFNSDGRDELILVLKNTLNNTTYIYRSDIGANESPKANLIYSSSYFEVTSIVAGDFMNTGKDYLATSFSNSNKSDNRVYISNIGNSQSPGAGINYSSNTYHTTASAAGDFKNLGHDELVISFTNLNYSYSFISKINFYNGNTNNPYVSSNRIYSSSYYHIESLATGSFRESLQTNVYNYKTDLREDVLTNDKPTNFDISQNYPNPFNPTTILNYSVANRGLVKIIVYDLQGRIVSRLVNGIKSPGTYSISFNGSELSSGVYIYSLITDEIVLSKKMILIK